METTLVEEKSVEVLSLSALFIYSGNYYDNFYLFCRRKFMFLLIDMKAPRTIWMRPRTQQWWMDVQSGKYGNGWWKDNLRMTEHTFIVYAMSSDLLFKRRQLFLGCQ